MSFVKLDMPLPTIARTSNLVARPLKYDFSLLQAVGDAVEVQDVVDAKKTAQRMTSAASQWCKRNKSNLKLAVRVFDKADGSQGVGVWVVGIKEATPVAETATAE